MLKINKQIKRGKPAPLKLKEEKKIEMKKHRDISLV